MEGRCRAIKRNGAACKGSATEPNGYCWAHSPEHAQQRRRTASRGGKSKSGKEIRDLKKQLQDLVEDVLSGRVERGNAVVANQILNTRARLIELERRVQEQDEVLARLEGLEAAAERERKGGKGGRRWPA